MPRRRYRTTAEQFADGVAFLALVTSIITHPKGFTQVFDAVQKGAWDAVYRVDWEYHVSPFTD